MNERRDAATEAGWIDRTLPNGLRVVLQDDAATGDAAVTLAYHVGGKDDPPGRSGFAHLFEHLMFKGTRGSEPELLDRLTEDVGGYNNAYTSADLTVYYEVVPSNCLESILWAEADRLAALDVSEANFRTERDVVIGEYEQRVLASPYGRLDELVERQVFAGHAYAQGVIGDPESLLAASIDDVRAFHARYYRPDNVVLAVVGAQRLERTWAWVERYFGGVARPAGAVPRPAPFDRPPAPTRREYRAANVPLAAINLAYPMPASADDDAPLADLVEFILGAGRSSRLHRALVHDTSLVSHVVADGEAREQAGLMTLRAIVNDDASLDAVEAILRREAARLCAEPVTASELARARRQLAAAVVRHDETPGDRSLAYAADAILRGDPRRVESDVRRYAQATPEDLLRVARGIFDREPAVYRYRGEA